jgi:predicted nuclease of predicted toxin-antitoxin system
MLRLQSDADVPGPLIDGLRQRHPAIDLVRAQEVGLRTAPDPIVLEWAATEGRIVISRDKRSLIKHANDRVLAGLPMPGVFLLRKRVASGQLIDEIILLDGVSEQWEWRDQVTWIPL